MRAINGNKSVITRSGNFPDFPIKPHYEEILSQSPISKFSTTVPPQSTYLNQSSGYKIHTQNRSVNIESRSIKDNNNSQKGD